MKVTANLAFFLASASAAGPRPWLLLQRLLLFPAACVVFPWAHPSITPLWDVCGVGAPRLWRVKHGPQREEKLLVTGAEWTILSFKRTCGCCSQQRGKPSAHGLPPPRPLLHVPFCFFVVFFFAALKMRTLLRSVGRANRGGSLLEAVVFFFFFYFCFTLAKAFNSLMHC